VSCYNFIDSQASQRRILLKRRIPYFSEDLSEAFITIEQDKKRFPETKWSKTSNCFFSFIER